MKQWQILKNGRRRDFAVIILITIIFVLVVSLNVRLIFQMTSNQTEEIGQTQLEVIRSEFQGIIYHAEDATARLAMETEQLLKSRAPLGEIENFFVKRKAERKNLTGGVCFNTYVASVDWSAIPDFEMPPDYHAPERIWYKGAAEKAGEIYITEPYVDAMTGDMCYTISKMLSDGKTVVAQDFTFADVHQFIRKMSTTRDRKALIVTANGMIIGYTDMSLVGKKISDKVESVRNKKDTGKGANTAMNILGKMPNIIRIPIVGFLKGLSNRGLLPSSLIEDNLYYSSMIVSNLGTFKCGAIHHNINDFGTASSLVTIGEIKEEIVAGKAKYLCEFGVTMDERIGDGFYFIKSLKMMQHLLDNPELLEEESSKKVELPNEER